MFFGDSVDFVHMGRQSQNMNRKDSSGVFGYSFLDFIRIYLECLWIGIGKHRKGTWTNNDIVCGDKCVWRNNDLIPDAYVKHM